MENNYQDIINNNYDRILELNQPRNGTFDKTVIKATRLYSFNNKYLEKLPEQMIFNIGIIDKYWPNLLTLIFYLTCIISSYAANKFGDTITLTLLISFIILLIVFNHEKELYKGNIILSNLGIKLYKNNFISWGDILESYIVQTGSGRYTRYFLTLSLKSNTIIEQEISLEFTSPYRKIGHYIERYNKLSLTTQ